MIAIIEALFIIVGFIVATQADSRDDDEDAWKLLRRHFQMAPVIDATMVMTTVVPNAHLKTYL
jgi:hypothetical protein